MRKPKHLDLNIGDIVESKRNPTKGQRYLIVDKQFHAYINHKYPRNTYNYHSYIAYSFTNCDYCELSGNATTQIWKIVG